MLSPVEILKEEISRFQNEIRAPYAEVIHPKSRFLFFKFLTLCILYNFCKTKTPISRKDIEYYYQIWLILNVPVTFFAQANNNFFIDNLLKNLLQSTLGNLCLVKKADDIHPTTDLLSIIESTKRSASTEEENFKNLLQLFKIQETNTLLDSWNSFSFIIPKMSKLNEQERNLCIQTPLYDDRVERILSGDLDNSVTVEEIAIQARKLSSIFSLGPVSIALPSLSTPFDKK